MQSTYPHVEIIRKKYIYIQITLETLISYVGCCRVLFMIVYCVFELFANSQFMFKFSILLYIGHIRKYNKVQIYRIVFSLVNFHSYINRAISTFSIQ